MFRVLKLEDHYARVGSAAYTLRQYISMCRLAEQIFTLDNDHLAGRCACCRIYYEYGASWHHNGVPNTHVRGSPSFIFPSLWCDRNSVLLYLVWSLRKHARSERRREKGSGKYDLAPAGQFSFNLQIHASKFLWLCWGKYWFAMVLFFPISCATRQWCSDTREFNYILRHVDHLIESTSCVAGSRIS